LGKAQANTSFHHIKFHESWFLQENFQKYLYIDQKTTEYEDAMPMILFKGHSTSVSDE